MAHTTQDLQAFIDNEANAAESQPKEQRRDTRAYLLGVQDAFLFLTTGTTTMGLAGRDPMNDALFQHDPNRPASTALPRGDLNTDPANPTVDIASDDSDRVNQGNDHKGEKVIDKVKRAVQTAFTSGSSDGADGAERPVGETEVVRRKR